jgi:hypothetical protein
VRLKSPARRADAEGMNIDFDQHDEAQVAEELARMIARAEMHGIRITGSGRDFDLYTVHSKSGRWSTMNGEVSHTLEMSDAMWEAVEPLGIRDAKDGSEHEREVPERRGEHAKPARHVVHSLT